MRDGASRSLFFTRHYEFLAPQKVHAELHKHKDMLQTRYAYNNFDTLFNVILSSIVFLKEEELREHSTHAKAIMDHIDPDDTPFIAAALAVENDGIWSDDKHFLQQDVVEIWTTEELLNH